MSGLVLSLYDYSGNAVRPWAEAGYVCVCVDNKHEGVTTEEIGNGVIYFVEGDLRTWPAPDVEYEVIMAFPPCTNLAVSGARWLKDKGIDGLSEALLLVERAREIIDGIDAPWLIENPVSTLSTYWREPDHIIHPYEYDGYTTQDNAYSKKTCLWTGGGLVIPDPQPADEFDDRIHRMAPSEDRSERRSETPIGFARALFHSNNSRKRTYLSAFSDQGTDTRTNVSALTDGGREIKYITDRDAVWMAVLERLRGDREPFQTGDILGKIELDVSDRTVRRVLNSMCQVGMLARREGRQLWYPGPRLTRYVGVSRPETVGFVEDADGCGTS